MKRFLDYTEEQALEAVKEYGDALKYVRDQTEAVCLEAVKQNGYALQYVREQTEAVCLEAVKQYGGALEYVDKYYKSVADITNDADYKALADNGISVVIELNGKKYKLVEVDNE